ncbi:hypothetical protein ACFL0O_12220, partial [Thermodesulfobacteriota bacterium]
VNSENVAVIKCPECSKSTPVDMSKYMELKQVIRFNAKCECGNAYIVIICKRDKIRKKTNLSGSYTNLSPGKERQKGQLTVLDVSNTGLKTKISQLKIKLKDHDMTTSKDVKVTFGHKTQKSDRDLNVGDILEVEFHLDNAKRSLVTKEVIIRWINMPYMGVEFTDKSIWDSSLGFYMMG